MIKTVKRNKLKASVLALALAALPLGTHAAGLGKLTVLSPLGQPLRAELEITATREELSSLSARLAPAEAFKQAGIEYVSAMAGVRFILDKRPGGQAFLRVLTDRPVNEPFLDLLVELNWASGKLVREYTFLLDPPEAMHRPAPAPVVAPEVKPLPAPPAPVRAPEAVSAPMEKPAAQVAPTAPPERATEKRAPKAAATEGSRTVVSGDTLVKIANEVKPEGVSLDQMLVALFRSNQDAFDAGNMNRLKAGKILSIPDKDGATAVEPAEARKFIVAQAADFNAYRRKLAAAAAGAEPVKEDAPKQAAAGKITPKVEEKLPAAAAGKDKLEVSRTEAARDDKAGKALQGRIAALEEDLVARDRALKEAGSRIADLERNIADLKKLAELKSQAAAQLQQQALAAKAAPPADVKKPEPAPAPVAEAKKPEPAPAAKPIEQPPAAEKPAEKPVEPPKPATAPKKPVPPPPPPPVAEPDFLEENFALVAGGGGVLALLFGFLGYSAWRRKRQSGGETATTTSRITEGDLTANSVFGSTGGQAVDTGASIQSDFSQANLSSIDADEGVDPVAEADVYMAYGRDAQAEEILIDALKNDPTRHAIHLKLLEIYAGRKSAKQFETLATDLYGQTGGAGTDWEKAASMGRTLDPANALYAGKSDAPREEVPVPIPDLAATTIIIPPSEVERLHDTVTMPGQLAQMTAAAELTPPEPEQPMALDFDLDLGTPPTAPASPAKPSAKAADDFATLDFDLDLGAPAQPAAAQTPAESAHLDFELSLPDLGTPEPVAVAPAPAPAPEAGGLDFEFDLDMAVAEEPPVTAASQATAAFDLGAISLDLEPAAAAPSSAPQAAPPVAASLSGDGEDNPDVATKLELAQAYEEMGDKEGARELLQEVLSEGSGRQQAAARSKLAQLDS